MPPLIITLTSIPSRFSKLGPTLASLLRQRVPASEVRLNIPYRYRRFPEWNGNAPTVPEGVTVIRTGQDFGPATKILPTVQHYRGKVVELLLCDDDRIYDRNWTARFVEARKMKPDCLIAEDGARVPNYFGRPVPHAVRTRKNWRYRMLRAATLGTRRPPIWAASGHVDIFKGYGGALLRPDFLPDFAFEIPDILWTVDDVWLSGCATTNGVGIWIIANGPVSHQRSVSRQDALLKFSELGHGRKDANEACWHWFQEHKGIWRPPADLAEHRRDFSTVETCS